MIKKEKRLKIRNLKILAKSILNNLKGNIKNLAVIKVIFMEILKQAMIFIKNILISHHNKIIKIAQRKISIHLGEIFIIHNLKIQISGSRLIKNRKNNNKRNKNKMVNKKKKKKEKSLGMEDIHKKKKIFLKSIIMGNKGLKKMLEIKI